MMHRLIGAILLLVLLTGCGAMKAPPADIQSTIMISIDRVTVRGSALYQHEEMIAVISVENGLFLRTDGPRYEMVPTATQIREFIAIANDPQFLAECKKPYKLKDCEALHLVLLIDREQHSIIVPINDMPDSLHPFIVRLQRLFYEAFPFQYRDIMAEVIK